MSVHHSKQSSKVSMNYADIMAQILNQNYQLVKKRRESMNKSI